MRRVLAALVCLTTVIGLRAGFGQKAAAPAPANAVVFSEDFEHFDRKRWDDASDKPGTIEIVDGGRDGKGKCVRMTYTPGKDAGGSLYKMLDPGLEQCYLRFYVKFEKDHPYVHHFVNLVGYNPPTRWPQGGAGEKPRGDDHFMTGIEPWGFWGKYPAPGAWNFYSYWCEMKQSRDGKYWGISFTPEEPVRVATDRWTCVEIMVKCNTFADGKAQADGEQAMWIDGKEVGRWGGIKWRTDPKLKVNGVFLSYYMTDSPAKQNKVEPQTRPSHVWFDDVVVSKEYVGPE